MNRRTRWGVACAAVAAAAGVALGAGWAVAPRGLALTVQQLPGGDGVSIWDCARAQVAQDLNENLTARSRTVVEPMRLEGEELVGVPAILSDYESFSSLEECRQLVGGAGIATGDVNGDGRLDYVHGSDIYLNTDQGWLRQELPRREGPVSEIRPSPRGGRQHFAALPLVADLDNDGKAEVVLQRETGVTDTPVHVYRQEGGKWVEDGLERGLKTEPAYQRGQAIASADMNSDGYVDLIVSRWTSQQESAWNRERGVMGSPVSVWLNRGTAGPGTFYDATDELAIPEAIAALAIPDEVRGFSAPFDPYAAIAQAILVADVDRDGNTDIFVQGDGGQTFLLWGSQSGRMSPAEGFPRGLTAMSAALRDMDGNGLMDIYVSNAHSDSYVYYQCPRSRPCDSSGLGNQLLLQTQPRTFVDAADQWGLIKEGWPWGAAWVDLENDADSELVVAEGYGPPLSPRYEGWAWRVGSVGVYRQESEGLLKEVSGDLGVYVDDATAGVQPGDFDSDGDLDVLLSTFRYPAPLLLRNDTRPAGNWLQVRAQGSSGGTNLDGRGAIVTVRAGGTVQTHELGTNHSYMSTGAPWAWFGLADATEADIEVLFPVTGKVVRLLSVPAGQTIVVQEGDAQQP